MGDSRLFSARNAKHWRWLSRAAIFIFLSIRGFSSAVKDTAHGSRIGVKAAGGFGLFFLAGVDEAGGLRFLIVGQFARTTTAVDEDI